MTTVCHTPPPYCSSRGRRAARWCASPAPRAATVPGSWPSTTTLLPHMALAYRDRDEAHGVVEDAFDNALQAPGWPLFAARMRALAGQAGLEVGTLTLDGQLAAYVVGFDDGRSYRVMDGRFVSAW